MSSSLQPILLGSGIGALIGGGIGFMFSKQKPTAPSKSSLSVGGNGNDAKGSPELKDVLDKLEPFQKTEEYNILATTLIRLETLEQEVIRNKKAFTRDKLTAEASRLGARADRMIDALQAQNLRVTRMNPLDMAEDTKLVKKTIADLKFNIYQEAASL